MNYYNENDPEAAAVLRELIARKLIPAGEVDERSITDVLPTELHGFVQCHFFAGYGGWPLAMRMAGWPDDEPADTGSCPCPPFSSAGKKKLCPECGGKPIPHPLKTGVFACVPCGHEWLADGRHLYPELRRIIAGRKPAVFFGEQVAGPDGLVWLAGVRATLEALGYAVGSSDLCAAGVGAPHIRQRLFWVAYAQNANGGGEQQARREGSGRHGFAGSGESGRMADTPGGGLGEFGDTSQPRSGGHSHGGCVSDGLGHADSLGTRRDCGAAFGAQAPGREEWGENGMRGCDEPVPSGATCRMGYADDAGSQGHNGNGNNGDQPGRIGEEPPRSTRETGGPCGVADDHGHGCNQGRAGQSAAGNDGPFGNGVWSDSRAIVCEDGKPRRIPTEPAFFPLADARAYLVPGLARRRSVRASILKGAGNAIVPELGAVFINAFRKTR